MTREEIIKLARQSGNVVFSEALVFGWAEVERFVALVEQRAAAAEREACVLELERNADKTLDEIVGIIRSRGEVKS